MATPIWVNIAAPSYNLNQCWSIISEVPWHSSESKLTVSSQAIILYNEFENYAFKIIAISPRGQWVKRFSANCMPFYLCPVLRVCTNEQIILATWWRHQMETFCVTGPFVRGIHRSPVNPLTSSDAELWWHYILWAAPQQTVEKTIEAPVIWDAPAFIITSP